MNSRHCAGLDQSVGILAALSGTRAVSGLAGPHPLPLQGGVASICRPLEAKDPESNGPEEGHQYHNEGNEGCQHHCGHWEPHL